MFPQNHGSCFAFWKGSTNRGIQYKCCFFATSRHCFRSDYLDWLHSHIGYPHLFSTYFVSPEFVCLYYFVNWFRNKTLSIETIVSNFSLYYSFYEIILGITVACFWCFFEKLSFFKYTVCKQSLSYFHLSFLLVEAIHNMFCLTGFVQINYWDIK